MSNTMRNLVLAAAALVTLGTMTLSSNEASARGFGGFRHGGFHHSGFRHGGFHHSGFRHTGFRSHFGFRHFGYRHYGFHRTFYRHYRFVHRWPARHYSWNTYWRPRVVIGAPIVRPAYASYNSYAAAPAPIAARPPCLTKQYTPQGAVVFVDRCTQESAMNPPPEANQASYQQEAPMPPQAEADPLPRFQGQAVPNGR